MAALSISELAKRIDELEGKIAALTAILTASATEEVVTKANVVLVANTDLSAQSASGVQKDVSDAAHAHLDLIKRSRSK